MIRTDQAFSDRVEHVVGALEKHTDAEVVVVAAQRSGSYRDTGLAIGSGAALATFLFLLALPWPVHPALVVVDLMVVWAVIGWIAEGHRIAVKLTTASRREQQVRQAAASEFHFEAVHSTPRRTGLLIYLSAEEGQVELIPDVGLEARIPRGMWAKAAKAFQKDDLESFVTGLEEVGALLAEKVPALDEDSVDLANAPRIR